eukprot:2523336-Pleurochrysis_carterae.AAC.1
MPALTTRHDPVLEVVVTRGDARSIAPSSMLHLRETLDAPPSPATPAGEAPWPKRMSRLVGFCFGCASGEMVTAGSAPLCTDT